MDVVALQVVTVGQQATERFDRLQAAGDYSEAYFTHGLAVQTAEATAEYLHRHIRRELGLPEDQGKRYSWGYPAIPELDDHRKVFDLLPAESELGMSLTVGLPAGAGAVHRGDHRAPPAGQVLQHRREPGGAIDRVSCGVAVGLRSQTDDRRRTTADSRPPLARPGLWIKFQLEGGQQVMVHSNQRSV